MAEELVWVRFLDSTLCFISRNGRLDTCEICKRWKLDPESLSFGPCVIAVGDDGLSKHTVVEIRQAASKVGGGDGKSQDTPFLLGGEHTPATPPPGPNYDDPWGDALVLNTAPSSMSNKVIMKLQRVDAGTGAWIFGKPAFYNYRPVQATPPLPLTLAHPVFGKFWDNYHGTGLEQPGRSDYDFFVNMAMKISTFYAEEADYRDEVVELWEKYTGMKFVNELNSGGGVRCDLGTRNLQLKSLNATIKTGSSSDPGFQAAQYGRLYWVREGDRLRFRGSCYPAIAIEHVGPCIRVSAVAVLDRFCCMPLTPFVNFLAIQSHDVEAAKQGARLCFAVKVALKELDEFYTRFKGVPERAVLVPHPMQDCQVTPVRFGEKLVYHLVREPGQTPLVVKFVQGVYGEEVHRAWASAGYAPNLVQVAQVPGGWWMVAMEHLSPQDGWKVLQTCTNADELRPWVLSCLAKAQQVPVNSCAQLGVHGDLRDANVVVRMRLSPIKEVKFIDFDWARPEGSPAARYPPYVGVAWPQGAEDCAEMLQIHDRELLSKKQVDQSRSKDDPFNSFDQGFR